MNVDFLNCIEKKTANLFSTMKNKKQLEFVGDCFPHLQEYVHKIVTNVGTDLDAFGKNNIFGEDFIMAIMTINNALESFLGFLNKHPNRPEQSLVDQFRIEVDLFSKATEIFSDIIGELAGKYIKDPTSNTLNLRIGLESALFSFACDTHPINQSPFYSSKFIVMYTYYWNIMNIQNTTIPLFKSVCGSGKTLCISWIIICRSLKEGMKAPFFLMTEPSAKHIEPKENFFNQRIGKYVTITSDENKLQEYYHINSNDLEKPVFGFLTPFNILPFLHCIKDIPNIYDITRIMIDEIHQRTFHLDVLVDKISTLNRSNLLHLPINVCFSSASIDEIYLKSLGKGSKIHKLALEPLYEVITRHPIIVGNIQKINNVVILEETVKVIKEMAFGNSQIKEGHVLCFCSGIGVCNRLSSGINSSFSGSKETKLSRKIVIIQTSLKPNESIENYFRRLTIEYEKNEGIREGRGYKKEFLYIVPIVLSGAVDDVLYGLAQNEFPGKLKSIRKLICATTILESSFNIDRLSVVIDSGLIKEAGFDLNTCLSTLTEKQTSWQSMDQRRGRLGRTMKGVYIPIHCPFRSIPDAQIPAVERTDLSMNILLMKDIGIDYENLKFLPTLPNIDNLKFSLETLENLKAIDKVTKKITPFGHELLNYPFLSIYYSAAVICFRNKFEEKNFANFIGAYLVTLISMESILLQEKSTEKLSQMFHPQSDISTLVNALNPLLLADIENDDEMRDLVEYYGFSYSSFLSFKANMQIIINLTFPGDTIQEVIKLSGSFVKKHGGIIGIMDILIEYIAQTFPKWRETHWIKFDRVDNAGDFESNPTILFYGEKCLNFGDKKSDYPEIRINKRPGWNGITIPGDIYCLNMSRNINGKTINGSLIHRKSKNSKNIISTTEVPKCSFSPWFIVLVDSYFRDCSEVGIKSFSRTRFNTNFHFSSTGGRVFVSFIPNNKLGESYVNKALQKLPLLMPFTPRSVIIFREDIKAAIEVYSIGTEHYETIVCENAQSTCLNKTLIDFCLKNLNLLSSSTPSVRIGGYFINQGCMKHNLKCSDLYFITSNPKLCIKGTYFRDIDSMIRRDRYYTNFENDTELIQCDEINETLREYQFPPKFIHPALMYHSETKEKILFWLDNIKKYNNKKVVTNYKVFGHTFLIKSNEIYDLQWILRWDRQQILKDIKITYSVFPVSFKNVNNLLDIVSSHKNWSFNQRFKVIIAPTNEDIEVNKVIQECEREAKEKFKKSAEENQALCCFYLCDDPDSPILTKYPITVFNKDGTFITKKMCRDCMTSSLIASTESFYDGNEIDTKVLDESTIKPSVIPSVESSEDNETMENWPQIPLGQLITALMNNDHKLCGLVLAWLNAVGEYSIRSSKSKFTYCPEHPHHVFKISYLTGLYGDNNYNNHGFQRIFRNNFLIYNGVRNDMCVEKSCFNCYCRACMGWHTANYVCDELKKGKKNGLLERYPKCPKCKVLTFKDGGCNHITCPCGCHWCYKCMAGFTKVKECYEHLFKVHGGCFDYNYD